MNAADRALAGYVDALEAKGAFASEPVRRAFRAVRRHRFLDGWYRPDILEAHLVFRPVPSDRDRPTAEALAEIYSDRAIVTAIEGLVPRSSTSQPSLVATMLELLELEPGMNVLEIGTGTGYNAALLTEIVGPAGSVCSVELEEGIAARAEAHLRSEGYANVHIFCRDGHLGVPEGAPFDRIIATVGCPDLSPHWIEELKNDGFMLVPLQHGLNDPLVRLWKDAGSRGRAEGRVVGTSGFMAMQGTLAWATPWRSSRIVGLPRAPTWNRPLPDKLASVGTSANPLEEAHHQGFAFFLSLGNRPLWYVNNGYGIADLTTSSAVVVTHGGLEGYSAIGPGRALDALHEELLALLDAWVTLGRPAAAAYDLSFIRKAGLNLGSTVSEPPGRTWILERPFFWEIVRPPTAHRASARTA